MTNDPDARCRRLHRAGVVCLAILVGGALTMCPAKIHAEPKEAPPDGFVWEDLKEIHARMLRPAKWLFRREPQASLVYDFSPQAFEGAAEVRKGLRVDVTQKVKAQWGKSAEDSAATEIMEISEKTKVLTGSTRKGEPSGPFTTYVLVCIEQEADDGRRYKIKLVLISNRETDTLYTFMLAAPVNEWKDVEQVGEAMLASLRPDPNF